VTTGGAERVVVRYRIYAHELRTQTSFVDADFALLMPAATFVVPLGQLDRPIEVTVEPAAGWQQVISGMESSAPSRFHADDYDQLVDSPIVAGNPVVHEFAVAGVPHLLVDVGGEQLWDGEQAARDLARVVEQHRRLWGSLPYARYVFLNLIVDAGGGTEHRNSVVMLTHRLATRDHKDYIGWLSLASHEHFHAWNVKRLRPVELGPFDYENENYTSNLWLAEGFTDYYADLQLARAGLLTRDEYLEALSEPIQALQTTPGRLVMPVSAASYDSWIKQYRPDENTPNSAISYYVKGSVIAFLLDARIRQATGGRRSLDDAMRLAFARYSGSHGYTSEDIFGVVKDVGGPDVASWLRDAVGGTAELDYEPAFATLGLELEPPKKPKKDEKPAGWTGLTVASASAAKVTRVLRDSPAWNAGLEAGDEILAVDEVRVLGDDWADRLKRYHPGDQAAILFARRGVVRTVPITFAAEPRKWALRAVEKPARAQKQRQAEWLGEAASSAAKP
jgi:predicted metalloprotease with PDZ domain